MNIVILTGAGISAESGLSTFRGQDGLWENHHIEDVASPEGFRRDPKLVHRFYNERRAQIQNPDITPNPGHLGLVELEKHPDMNLTLVTQNVDNLHEAAGNKTVWHMHGELMKVRCQASRSVFDWKKDTSLETLCPCCQKAGALRPHIVWFGEEPFYMDMIFKSLMEADCFVAIGTSGNVYPAAGFVQVAHQNGAHCIEVNPEPTGNDLFHEVIQMAASKGVPALLNKLQSLKADAASLP